jgi:hypothetical protein
MKSTLNLSIVAYHFQKVIDVLSSRAYLFSEFISDSFFEVIKINQTIAK